MSSDFFGLKGIFAKNVYNFVEKSKKPSKIGFKTEINLTKPLNWYTILVLLKIINKNNICQ